MAAMVVTSDTITAVPVRGTRRSYQYEKRVFVFTSGSTSDTMDITLSPLLAPCYGGSVVVTNTVNTASAIHTFVINPPTALVTTAAIFVSLASTTGATVAPTVKNIFEAILMTSLHYGNDMAFGFPGDVWKVRDTLSGANLTSGDTIQLEVLRLLID